MHALLATLPVPTFMCEVTLRWAFRCEETGVFAQQSPLKAANLLQSCAGCSVSACLQIVVSCDHACFVPPWFVLFMPPSFSSCFVCQLQIWQMSDHIYTDEYQQNAMP